MPPPSWWFSDAPRESGVATERGSKWVSSQQRQANELKEQMALAQAAQRQRLEADREEGRRIASDAAQQDEEFKRREEEVRARRRQQFVAGLDEQLRGRDSAQQAASRRGHYRSESRGEADYTSLGREGEPGMLDGLLRDSHALRPENERRRDEMRALASATHMQELEQERARAREERIRQERADLAALDERMERQERERAEARARTQNGRARAQAGSEEKSEHQAAQEAKRRQWAAYSLELQRQVDERRERVAARAVEDSALTQARMAEARAHEDQERRSVLAQRAAALKNARDLQEQAAMRRRQPAPLGGRGADRVPSEWTSAPSLTSTRPW